MLMMPTCRRAQEQPKPLSNCSLNGLQRCPWSTALQHSRRCKASPAKQQVQHRPTCQSGTSVPHSLSTVYSPTSQPLYQCDTAPLDEAQALVVVPSPTPRSKPPPTTPSDLLSSKHTFFNMARRKLLQFQDPERCKCAAYRHA
jgi:hypothetical protein